MNPLVACIVIGFMCEIVGISTLDMKKKIESEKPKWELTDRSCVRR